MRLQLLAEIEATADSAATEERAARRLKDWTYTDSEGRKWGVSPGKLHLGDLTLPFPLLLREQGRELGPGLGMGADPGGCGQGRLLRSWKERDKAIRERMNAERKPDTTRVRQVAGDSLLAN